MRGFFYTGLDIAERFEAEQALRALTLEARAQSDVLRLVTEAIPATVVVVGADGRYRFASGAFERHCGLPRERIIGRTAVEVLGEDEVARRLGGLARPADAVARLGGDEFVVALARAGTLANAETVADKVVAAVGMPFDVDGLRLEIGASVGVAFGVEPGGDWRELIGRADAALYRAKASGRGRHAKRRRGRSSPTRPGDPAASRGRGPCGCPAIRRTAPGSARPPCAGLPCSHRRAGPATRCAAPRGSS